MKKNMLSRSGAQDSITSVLAALLCVVIGLVGGYLVLLAINPSHAWGNRFVRILQGGFFDAPYGVGQGPGQRCTADHDRSVGGVCL